MDFLRNGILTEFSLYASFLQRVMLYMVEEDFKPTQPVSLETIRMTNEQSTFFRLLALGFLPLLVLMVGVFQYARRRGHEHQKYPVLYIAFLLFVFVTGVGYFTTIPNPEATPSVDKTWMRFENAVAGCVD